MPKRHLLVLRLLSMSEDNDYIGGGPGAFKEKNPSAEEFFRHERKTWESRNKESGLPRMWSHRQMETASRIETFPTETQEVR